MTRYIDVDKFINFLNNVNDSLSYSGMNEKEIIQNNVMIVNLNHFEYEDVEQVVRCKDCKYFDKPKGYNNLHSCMLRYNRFVTTEDGYCDKGESKGILVIAKNIDKKTIPPGETIKEQLEIHNISVCEFSHQMNITEQQAQDLLNGELELTEHIANQLEKVLGLKAKFWNNLERLYREKIR